VRRRGRDGPALRATKWIVTGAGAAGTTPIALHLAVVGHGFVLILLSSLVW